MENKRVSVLRTGSAEELRVFGHMSETAGLITQSETGSKRVETGMDAAAELSLYNRCIVVLNSVAQQRKTLWWPAAFGSGV